MHSLASLFVSLVIVANSAFPNSNIPKVLGVKIAENETETSTRTSEFKLKLFGGDREASESSENKTKRDEFKKKLGEIRDENKKKRLESLDTNFEKINAKATEMWTKALERMTQILTKIKTKTNEAATSGHDVTGVLAAISTAETKIADAKAAVTTQSQATYTVQIDSEKNLGTSVSTTVRSLRSDLKIVEAKIKDAKSALIAVFQALKAVIGTGGETATPTATPAT